MGAVLYEMLVGMPPFYTDNIQRLYKNIQTAKLQVPSVISASARDLLYRMLDKKPSNRITIPQLKQHAFFSGLDWQKLMRKQIDPPLHLNMNDDEEPQTEQQQDLDDEEAEFLNF